MHRFPDTLAVLKDLVESDAIIDWQISWFRTQFSPLPPD